MKSIVLVVLAALCMNGFSHAAENQPTNLSRKEIEKILVDKFVDIAAAYYINENCNFTTKEEKAEYVGQLANLNLYTKKLIGDKVLAAQKKGLAISKHKDLVTCGENAKNIVKSNKMLTKMMYEDLILK